ncbi:MAG: hypothetical protein K2X38_04780 [Gemmataceae bacterium]|nr:hypothetical protein [Gemmataceae bacterium]
MKRPAITDVAKLKAKYKEAAESGRSQSALRLARDIAHAEPHIDHRELLREAIRLRAEHLQRDNQRSEAAVLWRNLLALGEAPGIRELVAENLARCGFAAEATGLLAQLPADSPARVRALASLADGAIEKGPEGKTQLPTEHHAGFDAVLNAISLAHAGRDDEARSAIQSIGLQSPFLEWKVFLRGLLAWYASDDARALEAWMRLQPNRLPWRLAAPLRFGIDAEFRQTQSQAAQAALQKAADRATGSRDVELVRILQTSLQRDKKLNDVLRVAEPIISQWQTRPELAEPLRRTLAGVILQRGMPNDLQRLAHRFGLDMVEPEYARLLAVGFERRGQPLGAILGWISYLQSGSCEKSFGTRHALAKAMVWEHVGTLILDLDPLDVDEDDEDDFDKLPSFEDCFARSIELAPHRRRPYLLRFEALAAEPAWRKEAIAAGEALIEQFPDDPKTLEKLGRFYRSSNAPSKAFTAFERALALDPLNRKLRHLLGVLSLQRVISGVRTKLATQRADLAKAQELAPDLAPLVFARRHFLETTKGDPDVAAEAREKLLALPHVRLAAPFLLIAEGERYGIPAADTKKGAMVLRSLAKTGGAPEELTLLAEMMKIESEQSAGDTALQAGWAICKKAAFDGWPERLLERYLLALSDVPAISAFATYVRKAQKLHPKNPFLVLAEYEAMLRDRKTSPWMLRGLGERMESLFDELPRERQQEFLEQLEAHNLSLQELRNLGSPRSFLDAFFDSF